MAAPPPAPPAAATEPGLRAGTSAFLVVPPADTDARWASAKEWSLMGAPPLGLMRLLWTHWAKVDLRHRGVAARLRATVLPSLLNGFLGLVDWVVHGRAIEATPLCERPVFVLGLARSGTTMLHELLAADTDQFVTPDTFQVVHSSSFLTLRPLRQRLLAGALKPTRPMDNVAQSWDAPNEDGFAISALSGGVSFYPVMQFITDSRAFLPHLLTFDTPIGAAAFPRWRDAFLHFCRKVLYAAQRNAPVVAAGDPPPRARQLLLKSPPHTARIRILRQLFPGARFVYIHRHPEGVVQSTCTLLLRYLPLNALQGYTAADCEEALLGITRSVTHAYLRDRSLLSPGELVEVSYEKLTADPAGTLRHIYDTLGLHGAPGTAERDRIVALHDRIAVEAMAYKTDGKLNRHTPLSAEAVARLHAAIPELYEAGGYAPSHGVATPEAAVAATAVDGGMPPVGAGGGGNNEA